MKQPDFIDFAIGKDFQHVLAAPPKQEEGGRFFGRLTAGLGKALDAAKDAAKGAQIMVQKGMLEGKQNDVVRRFGKSEFGCLSATLVPPRLKPWWT